MGVVEDGEGPVEGGVEGACFGFFGGRVGCLGFAFFVWVEKEGVRAGLAGVEGGGEAVAG